MKGEIIVFFLSLLPMIYAQENNVPILVRTDEPTKNEKIVVYDESLNDSLKIIFNVKVTFKHPLKDMNQCVFVDSVELVRMKVFSLSENKAIIDFAYNKTEGDEYQRKLWNVCAERIEFWYENQPYNKMIDRSIWGKVVGFGGVVYLMPSTTSQY